MAVRDPQLYYDGILYRYRHFDANPDDGHRIVARLLGLNDVPPRNGLFYDLSFLADGCGVSDRFAISLPANAQRWDAVKMAIDGRSPEELADDPDSGEWFREFFGSDAGQPDLRGAVASFINSNKAEFQARCAGNDRHFHFSSDSNANTWTAVWGSNNQINLLGSDQG